LQALLSSLFRDIYQETLLQIQSSVLQRVDYITISQTAATEYIFSFNENIPLDSKDCRHCERSKVFL